MPRQRPVILVVAATERELGGAPPGAGLACGVGPVEAAARTAAALASSPPQALLHVGIAGARRGSGLAPLEVVIGSEARLCDAEGADPVRPDEGLLGAARGALGRAPVLPIGTSARVAGSAGTPVEAMEGYAVLLAARLAGVPALEVRVISNEIEEQDRRRWRFDDAFARVAEATRVLLPALAAQVAVSARAAGPRRRVAG